MHGGARYAIGIYVKYIPVLSVETGGGAEFVPRHSVTMDTVCSGESPASRAGHKFQAISRTENRIHI